MHGYCKAYTNARYKIKLKEGMHRHGGRKLGVDELCCGGGDPTYMICARLQVPSMFLHRLCSIIMNVLFKPFDQRRWCHLLCHRRSTSLYTTLFDTITTNDDDRKGCETYAGSE